LRARLADRVTHIEGDALTYPFEDGGFDAAASWLAIHHIPDRPRLLGRIASALRPGAHLYIEDLCERAPFTADDLLDVHQTLYGVTMTDAEQYARDVAAAGFSNIAVTDMSEDWTAFCADRAAAWHADADRHTRVHGERIFQTLDRFFTTVARMFASGRLGGLRIVASRVDRE